MWRGPVVEKRKNAVNAVKGKIFSIHAKLIAIAAQKWGDPDQNPSLAAAIHKAKKEGVPNDNVERAIKKWSWEDKTAAQIVEITYEWYAPGWVACVITTLTDNKNRTVSNIRHIFSKFGWNMWETWAVSWMFKRKWVIFIDPKVHSFDSIEEIIFDSDAEDMIEEAWYIKIISELDDFHNVELFFEEKNIQIMEAKLDYIPDNEIEITDFDKALKVTKMMEAFHDDEDVSHVSSNEHISPELEEEVHSFIEKNTFRT